MSQVHVYACRACKTTWDSETKLEGEHMCPVCGSMRTEYIGQEEEDTTSSQTLAEFLDVVEDGSKESDGPQDTNHSSVRKQLGNRHRVWRNFTDAREHVRSLKLKGWDDYRDCIKDGRLPYDIPTQPAHVYAAEWKNWPDWLGTSNHGRNDEWMPFEQARDYARSLKLSGKAAWYKLENKPHNIPRDPASNKAYRGKWKNWPDWLGTGNKARRNRNL